MKESFAEFPAGVIAEHEEPDFLVHGEERVVGIEIVHYVRGYSANGSKLRWREELQDQVVRSAKQKFEAEFHTPLSVRFHWFHHRLLRGAEVDSLATRFLNLSQLMNLLNWTIASQSPQTIVSRSAISLPAFPFVEKHHRR